MILLLSKEKEDTFFEFAADIPSSVFPTTPPAGLSSTNR